MHIFELKKLRGAHKNYLFASKVHLFAPKLYCSMRISHKEIAHTEGKGALRDSRWRKLLSVRHNAIDSTERERRRAITPPRHASSAVTRKGARHCHAEPVTGHLRLKLLLLSLNSLCFVLVLSKGSYKDETISCHSQKQKRKI